MLALLTHMLQEGARLVEGGPKQRAWSLGLAVPVNNGLGKGKREAPVSAHHIHAIPALEHLPWTHGRG